MDGGTEAGYTVHGAGSHDPVHDPGAHDMTTTSATPRLATSPRRRDRRCRARHRGWRFFPNSDTCGAVLDTAAGGVFHNAETGDNVRHAEACDTVYHAEAGNAVHHTEAGDVVRSGWPVVWRKLD